MMPDEQDSLHEIAAPRTPRQEVLVKLGGLLGFQLKLVGLRADVLQHMWMDKVESSNLDADLGRHLSSSRPAVVIRHLLLQRLRTSRCLYCALLYMMQI